MTIAMSEFIQPKISLPPSDEVASYPRVLDFIKPDWWGATSTCDDSLRRGITMAAVYADKIRNDFATCEAIANVSKMQDPSVCARRLGASALNWPRY